MLLLKPVVFTLLTEAETHILSRRQVNIAEKEIVTERPFPDIQKSIAWEISQIPKKKENLIYSQLSTLNDTSEVNLFNLYLNV